MDPIKSYDILYQSMFRVLTERKGKTNGYFVDMIADRAIRFIYNYTIQSKQSNKIEKIEMRKTDVRNSLLLFDVNGIREQIGYVEDVAVRNSYDKLAREFGIDKSSSVKFNMLVNEYNLSKSETKLIDTFRDLLKNADIERELKHILKNIMGENKRGKSGKPGKHMVDIQQQKVTFQSNQYAIPCADSEDPTSCEESILPVFEEVDDKTQIDIKLNAVTKMINNLFGMLCLFSENTNLDDVLSGEVDIDYERVRMCEDADIMHYCYLALNSAEINVSNLHKTPIEKIKEQVDKQLELLRSIYGLNSEELKESMNNLYDNIKSTMKELPEKLEEEKNKFQGLDTGFCPKDFIDNEKVLEIVRKHLTPKEEEKNLFGEVFTPLELVCEMLSKLPPRVWLDKDLKWLDPANGIGNFPIVVYYKLMDSLKDVIKTPKSRSKHIIENMLYMNELNAVNVGVCRSIFKMIDPNASPNIFRGDFLEKTDLGGVSQFDIIIGNPPFQKGQNSNFYVEFIKHSILHLNKFIAFVVPNRILIPEHRANEELLKINPFFINTNVNAYFNISTTTGYFIASKMKYENKTFLKFINGEMTTDLNYPTPTAVNDINVKIVSDKILLNDLPKLIFQSEKISGDCVFIKRQWMRYSPNKPNGGGDHIFQIVDDEKDKTDGKFIKMTKNLKWYLTRSKIIRFITKIYASSMNVPPFLWKIIPNLTSNASDEFIYKKLKLGNKDIQTIEKVLGDNTKIPNVEGNPTKIQAVVRGRQTRKKIKAINTIKDFISKYTRTKKGGSKSHNRKTRKMR